MSHELDSLPAHTRPFSQGEPWYASEDAKGGIILLFVTLAFLIMAGWMGYLGFSTEIKPLSAGDVVTYEARLLSVQPRRKWLEAHLDQPPGRPVEMPKSLFASLFHTSWPCREEACGKAGWPVVIGFDRSELSSTSERLQIVTLEANGTTHRTISQHNAGLRETAANARLSIIPLLMLAGFFGIVGHGRLHAAQTSRHHPAKPR